MLPRRLLPDSLCRAISALGRSALGALCLLSLSFPIHAQGPLANAGRHDGSIAVPGEVDTFTFSSPAGAGIMLRLGSATTLLPRIRVFNDSNVLIGEAAGASVATRDVVLSLTTTNAANYSVLVSGVNTSIGTYELHFAQAPGDFSVPSGDEGGLLESGANNPGNLTIGDLDVWRFNAGAGEGYMVRMGGAFTPWIRVYDPTGRLVNDAQSGSVATRDVVVSGVATNSGVYIVVTTSTVANSVGAYTVHFAHAPEAVVTSPGDQGGELVNGAKTPGEIITGDLDVWRFTANAGDSIVLRMGGAFTPWLRLYSPSGALVADVLSGSIATRDILLERTATNSGTYIVVASSTVSAGVGPYDLTLARFAAEFVVSPGDQGGVLTNGVNQTGNISNGDLDLWRFDANAGDAVILRMGGAFTPKIQLYGPNGALINEAGSGSIATRDVFLETKATNSGTYFVLASSTVASGAGNYNLHLAQVPSDYVISVDDEGGEIVSGARHDGNISTGDLDVWSFEAAAGEAILVRAGGNFPPWIRIYGPTGALAGEANSGSIATRDVWSNTTATNAGTYTVVVACAISGGSGAYELSLVLGKSVLNISPDDEGGQLTNGATNIATINVGDLDAWSFVGTVGDSNVFRVSATNFAPWIRLYGPAGTLVGESAPISIATRTATLIYELTNNPGNYTIVISSGVSGQSGGYSFKQSRWAPDLIVPLDASIDEGATLNVSISAQDPDEPTKPIEFNLLSGPSSAVFAIASATNATISLPTTEADGPVTNVFVVRLADVVNGRTFRRTNSFQVIVREINVAPVLTVPVNTAIDELTPLVVAASATDVDLPANPLTFSLLSPPEGMTINPTTGAIAWTPTEAQGPSTNLITVVVTDESPFAANFTSLSATNSFTVVVREINTPPQLTVPADQFIDELALMNVTASSSDTDIPANTRTYSVNGAPAGLTINPTTGAITWTPTEAQGPATNIISVVVTDTNPLAANATSLSTTNNFQVVVWEVNTRPQLTLPAQTTINELETLAVSAVVADADLPTNALTFTLQSPPPGVTINPNTGAISWTPTEDQGPSTNVLTVVVTDSNPAAWMEPILRATNSFTIVVNEVNAAPVLPAQANTNLVEGGAITVINTAQDNDLPANALAYVLAAGPTNAAISTAGVITWTSSEADGPGTHTFTTVVTDNGNPSRSATNTFVVTITETNSAPTLQSIPNQTGRFGFPWTYQPVATDTDLPQNALVFSIEQGPTNLTINGSTGALAWTPLQSQVGNHSVTLRVTDNGSPALTAEVTFQIAVAGEETRLAIAKLVTGLMQITIEGNAGINYELQRSSNLRDWEQQFEFRLTTSPFLYIDPDSQTPTNRFYRLRTTQ